MYCGHALPDPVGEAPSEPDLPADIDQLVRQAMSLGTTANLSRALKAHQEESKGQAEPVEGETAPVEPIDQGDLLRRLEQQVAKAIEAHQHGHERDLATALVQARHVLDQCDVPEPSDASVPVESPTIMLPKVRRTFALIMDGLGDVDRHTQLVEALGLDAVTARMLAIARQPRVAMRSDDRERLGAMASTLRDDLGIPAAVADRERLMEVGPARLLSSFANGALALTIPDWLGDLHSMVKSGEGEPVHEPPLLIVPGELVIMRYRPVRGGGRLKHLREGKLEAASEQRLAVVDLHLEGSILRILEGVTDLSDAPGAIPDGFRRSLRILNEQWTEQGIRMLEARTCSPAMDSAHTRVEEHGGRLASGWPEWEEHSRSARLLFMNDE